MGNRAKCVAHGRDAGHEQVKRDQLVAPVVQLHGELLLGRLDVLVRAVQAVGQVVDLRSTAPLADLSLCLQV